MTLLVAPSAMASEVIYDFREAVTQAIMTSPDVSAALYEFEATLEEQRAARGGYFPKLDLVAEAGRADSSTPLRDTGRYSRDSTRLVLSQMLFDGFATSNEVDRLDHAKRGRYFELKSTSEDLALGAAQAYLDVLRQQKLVKLAEENYVQHQLIFDDIEQRVVAGVGRRVDLEQASARSSLAATNLLTETSNLYDVTVRFQRIVGASAGDNLVEPTLPVEAIPSTRREVLLQAYAANPQLSAAVENVLAAQAELQGKNAAMMPRFDLRLRQEMDNNTDGILGSYDESAVEVVMTYNLYNGGSDRARQRQFYQRVNGSQARHEQACRDVRQLVSIAYNDIQALAEQVKFLNQNQIAVGKARQSYRKQFDIGQRSLLDLLDTENEYFEVRRSFVNASQNLLLAQARTLAGMGLLMESLSVNGLSQQALERLDSKDDHNSDRVCPQEVVAVNAFDKEALMAQAMQDHRFRQTSEGNLAFRMSVEFANGSTVIEAGFTKDILDAARFLNENPSVNGVIAGHTDSTGSQHYNGTLSRQRAEVVRQSLIESYGIAPARLTAKGYGESQPLADNATAAGRAENRRVEMVVTPPTTSLRPMISR
jgi:adhesin transport system outer membrane protein